MKILIVEDDRPAAMLVKNSLEASDHTVELAFDGAEGLFMAKSFQFDAIVLDYSLPKKCGLEVCTEVRRAGKTTPILFLTVSDDMDTKLMAFEHGADDYMVKPFELKELHARLRALSRRPQTIACPVICIDDLSLDSDKHIVKRGTKEISMTRKEFSLLEYLMKHSGTVMSRAMLMEHVWTADSNPFSNTLEAHIRTLRRKIGVGNRPNLIANIPGRGYIIDSPKNLARYKR